MSTSMAYHYAGKYGPGAARTSYITVATKPTNAAPAPGAGTNSKWNMIKGLLGLQTTASYSALPTVAGHPGNDGLGSVPVPPVPEATGAKESSQVLKCAHGTSVLQFTATEAEGTLSTLNRDRTDNQNENEGQRVKQLAVQPSASSPVELSEPVIAQRPGYTISSDTTEGESTTDTQLSTILAEHKQQYLPLIPEQQPKPCSQPSLYPSALTSSAAVPDTEASLPGEYYQLNAPAHQYPYSAVSLSERADALLAAVEELSGPRSVEGYLDLEGYWADIFDQIDDLISEPMSPSAAQEGDVDDDDEVVPTGNSEPEDLCEPVRPLRVSRTGAESPPPRPPPKERPRLTGGTDAQHSPTRNRVIRRSILDIESPLAQLLAQEGWARDEMEYEAEDRMVGDGPIFPPRSSTFESDRSNNLGEGQVSEGRSFLPVVIGPPVLPVVPRTNLDALDRALADYEETLRRDELANRDQLEEPREYTAVPVEAFRSEETIREIRWKARECAARATAARLLERNSHPDRNSAPHAEKPLPPVSTRPTRPPRESLYHEHVPTLRDPDADTRYPMARLRAYNIDLYSGPNDLPHDGFPFPGMGPPTTPMQHTKTKILPIHPALRPRRYRADLTVNTTLQRPTVNPIALSNAQPGTSAPYGEFTLDENRTIGSSRVNSPEPEPQHHRPPVQSNPTSPATSQRSVRPHSPYAGYESAAAAVAAAHAAKDYALVPTRRAACAATMPNFTEHEQRETRIRRTPSGKLYIPVLPSGPVESKQKKKGLRRMFGK